jgi:hypothetical protein
VREPSSQLEMRMALPLAQLANLVLLEVRGFGTYP